MTWRALGLLWMLASVATVVRFIRLGRLRVKYAVPTLVIGMAVGVLALTPSAANWLANRLRLDSPASVLLILIVGYTSGMSLVAVRELSRLEARTRSLAEALALLDAQTESVRQRRFGGAMGPDEQGDESDPEVEQK